MRHGHPNSCRIMCLNERSPASGTISGGCGAFRRLGLARGSSSRGNTDLEVYRQTDTSYPISAYYSTEMTASGSHMLPLPQNHLRPCLPCRMDLSQTDPSSIKSLLVRRYLIIGQQKELTWCCVSAAPTERVISHWGRKGPLQLPVPVRC